MKIGVIGTGQFAGSFIGLWQRHPEVSEVWVTDVVPERAETHRRRYGLAGVLADVDDLLGSDLDAVAVMTQRWTHGPLAAAALRAGKHVYSAVPMAATADEIATIVDLVSDTGLVYMMGETSYYYPAVIYARDHVRAGEFGRLFYAEGDYVHDMDNGFYAAYRYSGGPDWRRTASYPPMLYPTHAIGGVLGAWPTYATSVSCLGVTDHRDDGVFDRAISMFGNDFSNMSALFALADGGMMRTNEFRRVGHPPTVHESRYRFYGTMAVMEQTSVGATWSTVTTFDDIGDLFHTGPGQVEAHAAEYADLDPALLLSFTSGSAPVQDRSRLPREFDGAPNGHQGSHHFLADDFVRAVTRRTQPPVNAWVAARFTLPGVVAYDSARDAGRRLSISDHGSGPEVDRSAFC